MTEEYYDIISDAWKLMHKYINGKDTDEFWKNVRHDSDEIYRKHGMTPFVRDIIRDVVKELHDKIGGKE